MRIGDHDEVEGTGYITRSFLFVQVSGVHTSQCETARVLRDSLTMMDLTLEDQASFMATWRGFLAFWPERGKIFNRVFSIESSREKTKIRRGEKEWTRHVCAFDWVQFRRLVSDSLCSCYC